MVNIFEYVVTWSGGRIGTGNSVFHLGDSSDTTFDSTTTAFRAWFTSLATYLPNEVSINFPSEVKMLDSATGELLEIYPNTPGGQVTGTAASQNWSAPTGRVVKWQTNTIAGGRRLIGRTFIVPSSDTAYNEGSIQSTTRTSDNTAHATLLTALPAEHHMVIWSRKHGATGLVTAGTTLVRPTTLRSRND